ncbi:MAG: sigma 54-interacting transcriptional regulator [Myxococcales bacterium]|nr:sigma 54-interacting transcriptional regulator [Myxococcales bacterium]
MDDHERNAPRADEPFGEDMTTTRGQFSAMVAQQERERRFTLLVYYRDGAVSATVGPDHAQTTIGRARPSDIVLPERSLSRRHARFVYSDGALWVEDLASTNGTKLNGREINKREQLMVGDEAQLGSVTVTVHGFGATVGVARDRPQSYERFAAQLLDDALQAHTFGRSVALLMVRAGASAHGHVMRWYPAVREQLRPVDHVGLYGPESLLICLRESTLTQATDVARRIANVSWTGGSHSEQRTYRGLMIGAAAYPQCAASGEELIEVARRAVRRASPREQVKAAPPIGQRSAEADGDAPLVKSPALRAVYATVDRVARHNIPALITGETGSGKELVAQALHERSGRHGQLRCINCGAIPATLIESVLFGHERGAFTSAERRQIGVFEDAHNGTVLLDEIGELSPEAQAALLRVLETKRVRRVGGVDEVEVDVRVVAATHRDLEAMCQQGTFRLDLLYRLNAVTIKVPPLRERAEDIMPLARRFLAEAARETRVEIDGFAPEVERLFQRYRWPGNVRELRNVVERAVIIANSTLITAEDLPEPLRGGRRDARGTSLEIERVEIPPDDVSDAGEDLDFKTRIRNYEIALIADALEACGGNQSLAARRLRIPRRTLVRKLREYGLRGDDDDDGDE